MAENEKKYNGVQKVVNTMRFVGGVCILSVVANAGIFYFRHQDEERMRTEQPYPSERMDALEQRLRNSITIEEMAELKSRINDLDGVLAGAWLSYKQEAEKKGTKPSWSSFRDELAAIRSEARKSGGLATGK